MGERNDVPVLIVGAGPTGLALACDLARRGVECRVVDRAPVFQAGSRGKSVQPRTLEVFDDLGVLDEVLAFGAPALPYRAYDGDRVLGVWASVDHREPTSDVPYPNVLMIPQWRVEDALRRGLAQHRIRVEVGTELLAFDADADGVTATLADPDRVYQVRADYLVGADGGRSTVRKQLAIPFEGETYDFERVVVADVEVRGLDRGHCHTWPRAEGGTIALYPVPATGLFQMTATGDDELGDSAETLRREFTRRTGSTDVRLSGVNWMSRYRVNIRTADRFRAGRVFLAGDAAHVYPPSGGQGMNAGIQDAYNLGWKMGNVLAGAPASLLDTYETERVPIASRTRDAVSEMYHRLLFDEVSDQPAALESSQLTISYRGGPLAHGRRVRTSRVEAGDRAPDALCHLASGAEVRLFDVFRGPRATVLAFGSRHVETVAGSGPATARVVVRPGERAPCSAIVDTHGHAHRAYDITTDTVVVVRPDGHISLISEDASPAVVHEHLAALG